MSRSRREELAEEALAEIEWSELGLASPAGSGLTQPAKADPYGDRSLHYFAYSYTRAFELGARQICGEWRGVSMWFGFEPFFWQAIVCQIGVCSCPNSKIRLV